MLVVGSLNLDLLYRVPQLPRPGETVLGADLVRLSGGKGGNQAHAAAKAAPAGVAVAMVACVGDDDASGMLKRDLAAAGVDIAAVRTVAGPSGTALIAVDDRGENTIVVIPAANRQWPPDAVSAIEMTAGDVVVVQLEVPFEIVEAVIARAVAVGARVVLNAAPLDRRATRLLGEVDAIVVNEIEAAKLFGFPAEPTEDDVAGAAGRIGADVVVTLGSRGVVFAPAGGTASRAPAFVVDATDTVGAGDAFVGVFAAALAAGAPLATAVRWGSAAGALTATVPGARHPGLNRESVEALAGALG